MSINNQGAKDNYIYLDFLSASPLLPEVIEAMLPFFNEQYGNASSLHRLGLYAKDAIEEARKKIARLINAESPEQIYFTSDATESANWAIKGSAEALKRYGNHIILSAVEHPSILESAAWLEKQGFSITKIPVDSDGKVNPELIKSALTDSTILIAIQLANPDIGTIQPVEEISKIASDSGIQFYVDVDAGIGWHPVDAQKLNADLLTFSAQRFYGPKGCGVLYRSRKSRLSNLLHGGNQESGRRAGIENVPAIVGAGKAAEIALSRINERIARARQIQDLLWNGLKNKISHIKLNGPPIGAGRLPNSLNVSFEFIEGEGLVLLCDMQNLMISSGTVCSSRGSKIPHTLQATGINHTLALGSVLFSWGEEITDASIERAVDIISNSVNKLRTMSASWNAYQSGKLSPLTPEFIK